MINRDALEKLTEQIGQLFDRPALPSDLQTSLRALIQSGLGRLDVVTRDEFDAQTAVLERTRAKLDALERQLDALAQQLDEPPQ